MCHKGLVAPKDSRPLGLQPQRDTDGDPGADCVAHAGLVVWLLGEHVQAQEAKHVAACYHAARHVGWVERFHDALRVEFNDPGAGADNQEL